MKKTFYTLLILFLSLGIKAQLNGTYTIGTGGNYSSFNAAVSALNSQGISGNVYFNVSNGTYTEQISINNFSGNSSFHVYFQGASGDSSTVILNHPSSSSSGNNFALKFNGAKNITFSDMTVSRSGSGNYSVVVELANSSNNIAFERCVIKNNNTQLSNDYAALIVGKNTSNSNLHHVSLSYCKVQNGSYGIFLQGLSSGSLAQGFSVENCIFDNQYRTAIYAAYQLGAHFNKNNISSSSSYYQYRAIDGLYINGGTQIKQNKISLNKGTAIYLVNSSGSGSSTAVIFNNFISLSGSGASAISFNNAGTYHLYFNSINLYSAALTGISVSGSNSNHLRMANNILNSTVSGSKLMVVASSTNIPFDYLNYNNYYTSALIGDWKNTSGISSLASWKTASGYDAMSLSVNPNFVSNTDLHIQNSGVQRAGTSSLVTPYTNQDIDNNQRHNTSPDMGAHEYSFDDLALSKINVAQTMCINTQHSVKIWVKNLSNHSISANLPVNYSFNGNSVSELFNISNLAAGDSSDYIFNAKISSQAVGAKTLTAWLQLNQDVDNGNDTLIENVNITAYPVVNLPNDTFPCANNSIVLDAGPGFDAYLWSTGDTTQSITIDTNGIGLSGNFFAVTVFQGLCSGSDSTLVVFQDCSGIEESSAMPAIKVYPVPAGSSLRLQYEPTIKISALHLVNLNGQRVKSFDPASTTLDISDIPSGLYFLSARHRYGISRLKFVKQ